MVFTGFCLRTAFAGRIEPPGMVRFAERYPTQLDRTFAGSRCDFRCKRLGYTIEDLYNPSRYDLWGELYGTGTGKRLCQATDHPRSGKSSS